MAPVVASRTPPLSPCSPSRKKAKFSLRLKGKKTKDEEDDKVKPSNVYPIFSSPSQGKDENYDENNLDKEPEMPSLPHAGLLNQGNTCYANAVLQVLRCCPGFEQLVGYLASRDKDVRNDKESNGKRDETEELITQLEELLCQMCTFEDDFMQDKENCIHLSEKGNSLVLAAETFQFMEAFRELYPAFESNLQHDAQEFLCSLIMALQEVATSKAKKNKKHVNCSQALCQRNGKRSKAIERKCNVLNVSDMNSSIACCMEHLFQGKLVHQTKCLNCEESKLRHEDFQDVSVPVVEDQPYLDARKKLMLSPTPKKNKESVHTLQWAISQFASSECLQDDNKYFCENCNTYCEAEIRTCFDQLPGVLIIHLKRFTSSVGLSSKITSNLQTPFVLSVQEWCSKKCQMDSNVYELFGIVVHSGMTSGSGHYETYVRLSTDQYSNDKQESPANSNGAVQNVTETKCKVKERCFDVNSDVKCNTTKVSCNRTENVPKTDINGNCVFEDNENKPKLNGKSKRKRSRKSENGNVRVENGIDAVEKSPEDGKESKRKKLGDSGLTEPAESPLEANTQQTSCMSVITRYFHRSRKVSSGKRRSNKSAKIRSNSDNDENTSSSNNNAEDKMKDNCSEVKENENLKYNENASNLSKNVKDKMKEDCSDVKDKNSKNNESTSNSHKNIEEKLKENSSDVKENKNSKNNESTSNSSKNIKEKVKENCSAEENEEKPQETVSDKKPKGCASIEHYFKKTSSNSHAKNITKSPAIRKLNFQGNSERESVCNGNSESPKETETGECQNSSSDEELQIRCSTVSHDERLKTGWVHFDDCTVASLPEQDILSILSSSDSSFTSPYLLFYRKIASKNV